MATQTFPKSYLLERIDARLASLERQDVEDTKVVAEYRSGQDKRYRKWLKEAHEEAVRFPAKIDSIVAGVGKDWKSLTEAVAAIQRAQRNWSDAPGERYEPYGNPGRAERDNATNAEQRLRVRATERDALSHTRAYLSDTPIEEFSTTMLGRLGLLDAVKFSLDEARAEAQGKAKRR